jgi:flagellar basal body rod protein FlgC
MFLSKLLFLPLLFALALVYPQKNSTPASTDSYVDYLKTKEQIHLTNIQNAENANYIPQQVIWDDIQGILTAPRINPFRRVFDPASPKANQSGMIFYPNIDRNEEMHELHLTRQKLSSVLALKVSI